MNTVTFIKCLHWRTIIFWRTIRRKFGFHTVFRSGNFSSPITFLHCYYLSIRNHFHISTICFLFRNFHLPCQKNNVSTWIDYQYFWKENGFYDFSCHLNILALARIEKYGASAFQWGVTRCILMLRTDFGEFWNFEKMTIFAFFLEIFFNLDFGPKMTNLADFNGFCGLSCHLHKLAMSTIAKYRVSAFEWRVAR